MVLVTEKKKFPNFPSIFNYRMRNKMKERGKRKAILDFDGLSKHYSSCRYFITFDITSTSMWLIGKTEKRT